MLDRIKKLFAELDASDGATGGGHGFAEKEIAACALLIEAAGLDGEVDEAELATIRAIATERFGLDAGEAESLIEEATRRQEGATQLIRFTRAIKDHYDEAARIEIIEMLWEVAYADGVLHDYEANLLRRVAGLVYVSDRDRGAARKRVLERLGLSEST